MLRPLHIPWLLLAFLAADGPGGLRAGSLEKVWEVDLKDALQGKHLGSGQSYKVVKILFSPDAEQIAVFLAGGNIELLRAQDPKTIVGEFKNDGYDFFGWSPDSQTIHTGTHVVQLRNQKTCDLPPNSIFPAFIGKDKIVAFYIDPQPSPHGVIDFRHPGPAHLRLYDTDCREQDSWEVPSNWLIKDASPDRGLLSVSVAAESPSTELIVSPFEKKILRSTSGPSAPRGRFADQGKAICANICWSVDTGKRIVPDRSIRVLVDDYKPSLFSAFAEMSAKRRVGDIKTHEELVSWKLKFITYGATFDLDGYNRDRRPVPAAISPDGEYVIEGGDGKIWEYRVRP